MSKMVQLLDCTLRDGAYIVDANFGVNAIKGIIKKLQDANVDFIECGWLKDSSYKDGTTFYHLPSDLKKYLPEKGSRSTYIAMIDWNRYDLSQLPQKEDNLIDAIRVVFPKDKFKEGMALGAIIKEKGYDVYFQAANTLAYSDEELIELAKTANEAMPECLSVVDTFGAMYREDLEHILSILDAELDARIKIGFHSHNNQQLSYALSMEFINYLTKRGRHVIIDSSLCGMGRGAGNTTTELITHFLNDKYQGNYDMNMIMDAIDMYMQEFIQNYKWGYSTPYFIAGMYCTHVNNIAYLLKNHRTTSMDMRNIIGSMKPQDRINYDYDLLEEKYLDYVNKAIDDEENIKLLKEEMDGRKVLLLLPGKSTTKNRDKICRYIEEYNPIVIGVNAILENYDYDYIFFSTPMRYEYAKDMYSERFARCKKIVTSNIKTEAEKDELIVNFNLLVKRGWEHFDNSGIMCLRLLNRLCARYVALCGFDGFEEAYNDSYADISLPHINPGKNWDELNAEIKDMFEDYKKSTSNDMTIEFVTESKYDVK